ncbi:hypothetical protein CHISP_0708 [Chitinispirillum alkaliphilum]|nr:hypothetical protein CHISP_0708 [Chitinispirillum alkaliphilum]
MIFRDPYYLLLFLIWAPLIWVYIRREKSQKAALSFSDLSIIKKLPSSPIKKFRHLAFVLFLAGTGFLIIALARPQKYLLDYEQTAEGIDIMLVLDISNSMRALDFEPEDRLVVSKNRILDFIDQRKNDRIGLVIFAARAYTKCPLTLDYDMLREIVDGVTYTDFSSGTAIGTAIATAANRLKDTDSENKVIVLLTDGANNTGELPPLAAARAAADLGIRIYTIGVGKEGRVPFPVESRHPITGEVFRRVHMIESDLDEPQLIRIAEKTGGKYFRAQDANALKDIYREIDKLEKSDLVSVQYANYTESFFIWLLIGFLLLLSEAVLRDTVFRRIP